MGLLLVSLVLSGAAQDVEALQRGLTQPWDGEDDVVVSMGSRLLTREGLRDAVRIDPTSFGLLDQSVTRHTTARRLGWGGLGATALAVGVFSLGAAAVVSAGVLTPLAVGLFVASGVLVAGALGLAVTALVFTFQAQGDFTSGVRAWNEFLFAQGSEASAPFVRAVQQQWLGLCADEWTLCVGPRRLDSNAELVELLRSRSEENAARLQQALADVTTGMVLAGLGIGLEIAALPLLLLLAPPLNLALAIPAMVVGLGIGLLGSWLARTGGRGVQEAIGDYNFAVVNDALKAARAAEAPAPASELPAEPPLAPQDVQPAPPAVPTPPPAPPPTGPTRQPLRPRTSLDGPTPSLVLATF
ncbi:MAG: hypothetical protein IT380_22545 [Myxococcales bacterium]|nr:hypothetical protein [Myxococcales bacterium]